MRHLIILLCVTLLIMLLTTCVATESVLQSASILQSDGDSRFPKISDAGRFIAFVSWGKLTQNSIDDAESVFVYDRETERTELVSVALDGNASQGRAFNIALSGSGRFVAFHSHADDLVIGDDELCDGGMSNCADLFVYDRHLEKMIRIPRSIPTGEGSEYYPRASFSPDERLVYSDGGDRLHDLTTGEIVRTLTTPDYFVPDGPSLYFWNTQIDQTDGNYTTSVLNDNAIINYDHSSSRIVLVAFSTMMANFTNIPIHQCEDERYSAGVRPCANVFIHNLETGETLLATVGRDGWSSNADVYNPKLSANGRFLAFSSSATNLTDDDFSFCDGGYQCSNVFIRDLQTNETTLISRKSNDMLPAGYSRMGDMSEDGQVITFSSEAGDIVTNDTNSVIDIFVYERQTGKITLISRPDYP